VYVGQHPPSWFRARKRTITLETADFLTEVFKLRVVPGLYELPAASISTTGVDRRGGLAEAAGLSVADEPTTTLRTVAPVETMVPWDSSPVLLTYSLAPLTHAIQS